MALRSDIALLISESPRLWPPEQCTYLFNAQCLDEDTCRFPLNPELILAWHWQRWEMEVAHREMKSGLGVGE